MPALESKVKAKVVEMTKLQKAAKLIEEIKEKDYEVPVFKVASDKKINWFKMFSEQPNNVEMKLANPMDYIEGKSEASEMFRKLFKEHDEQKRREREKS